MTLRRRLRAYRASMGAVLHHHAAMLRRAEMTRLAGLPDAYQATVRGWLSHPAGQSRSTRASRCSRPSRSRDVGTR